MNKIKSDLYAEIAARVSRKEKLKKEIADRNNNVEAFALNMLNELEEMITNTVNTSLIATLAPLYGKSFEGRIKAMDPGCEVDIQWLTINDTPRVNGILIKWSKEYQQKNNCEEQLFVDVTSLLFK